MKKLIFLLAAVALITACGQPPATASITVEPSATRQPPAPTQTAVPPTSTPTATPTSAPTPTPTPTPVPLSRLHVVGNEIKNDGGEVVVLRGVSIADPAILYYEQHWTAADYEVLADDWGAEIIRVPIHPSTWEHDPDYAKEYLDPIVEWGERFGLYIFLGYHAHGNPITNEVEQAFWWEESPWGGKLLYDPDLELARSALATMAKRYKDEPHVLYGTFNEPSYIDWRDWRPVAEELVDVIHAINPEALVFVSGTDWGYDLSGAISDPVQRNNVVYETHPYPWKPEGWQTTVEQLAQTAPVFIGEWGFSIEHPDDDGYVPVEDYGIPLIQFADKHGIGWTAWVWHPEWTPRMLKSWRNYTPTGFGQLVKNSLAGETLTFAIPTPTLSPEQRAAAGYVIYDDALRSDWYLDEWNVEADMEADNVVHSGQLAIAVTIDSRGVFALGAGHIDISDYGYLEFYINGGSQGGQSLAVFLSQQRRDSRPAT
jgi:endoglucanase